MKNIDSDLIRGNIDTIILKTMLDGDKYGLDIIKEVEARSNGTYELKQPTLYSCLKRLENQELISSYWLDSDIGGKRHYYKLTEKGHEFFQKKQEEWSKSKFIIDNLLSNFDYDEYRLVKKEDYDKIIEGKQFVYESDKSPEITAQNTDEVNAIENIEDYEISESNESQDSEVIENFDEENDIQTNDEFANQQESDVEHVEENEIEPADNTDSDIDDFNNIECSNIVKSNEESNESEQSEEPKSQRKYYVDFDEEDFTDSQNDINDSIYLEDNNNTQSIDDYGINLEEYNNSDDSSEDNFETEESYESENEPSEDDEISEEEDFQNNEVTYVSSQSDQDETPVQSISKEPEPDYSSSESNILAKLRHQDDEEINTYYGNQQSYLNHLNQKTEENYEPINMFGNETLSTDVDRSIDEFSKAVEELNNFSSEQKETEKENEYADSDENNQDTNISLNEDIDYSDAFTKTQNPEILNENKTIYSHNNDFHDNYLDELNELNSTNNTDFYNSVDNTDYDRTPQKIEEPEIDYNLTDSSDASYENISESNDYNDDYSSFSYENENSLNDNYDFSDETSNESESENTNQEYFSQETSSLNYENDNNVSNYNFDDIIARNISSNSSEISNSTYESFTPRYTSENYKEKLNNLSIYSKHSTDDEEKPVNEEALAKAKDIETLKSELEQEGIKVKEFKKFGMNEQAEKTYLLSNKINFVRSLILLFGYVFVLSALYIILNNTGFKNTTGFSLKYFLWGFLPFAILTLYDGIMFAINPYKKVPAKYAPRIMIFISIIITIQFLLITYCVNLQLGFYSFTQSGYNHLLWVIPTIISFAPIIRTLTYMILFYSKNFNI